MAQWEHKSLPAMVREVEGLKGKEYPLTSAIRLFILRYHRSGAAARRMTSVVEHDLAPEIEQTKTLLGCR